MIYSTEVKAMCPVHQGVHHGAAPIPEEAKWVKSKEVKDISGYTHGIGWCAPQQGACKLSLNVKDGIIQEALESDIHVGWSNPCFEIWLYAYFGEMPNIQDSVSCCSRFFGRFEKETGHPYGKNDTEVYRRITKAGDFELAYQIAERKCSQAEKEGKKPSQACPACTVHRLVKEIKDDRHLKHAN